MTQLALTVPTVGSDEPATTDPQLTPEQQAALHATGDTLLSAAAGSGKTRVLVERIVRALVHEQVPVSGLVAVTFTEQAAQEIRERVADRLVQSGQHALAGALEHAAIGTIHGLCARIVRRYGARVGIDPGFQVLDAAQVAYLRKLAVAHALEQDHDDRTIVQLRLRYGDARLESYLLSAYEAAAQRPDRSLRFTVDDGPQHDAAAMSLLYERFARRYRELCRAAGGLDFDDLQHSALAVLGDEACLLELRCAIQRVLVDEFQDTNALQCAVLDLLGSGCTFAVGDEWQSIYRFRKADVAVFRARAADPSTRRLSMRQNFRSRPALLAVVNHAFSRLFGAGYEDVHAGREAAAAHEPACEVVALPGLPGGGREAEAAWVADRIAQLVHDEGVDPGEIAILLARQTHAQAWEGALARVGIRSVRSTSTGFWGQQQVADVASLLAWARNRRDDRAALSVLAAPWVGLHWDDLLRLRRIGGDCIWSAVEQEQDERVVRAREAMLEVARLARDGTLVDAVHHAVFGTGYLDLVLAGADGRRRAANMRKLVELAASAHQIGIDDLGRFLELVRAQRAASVEGEASIAEQSAGAVRIMTVHGSKGLEFPHVFVSDCGNAGRLQQPDLLVAADGVASFATASADGLEIHVGPALAQLRRQEREQALAEEQRLFYVALTRARERLWITGTLRRQRDGSQKAVGPLAWLEGALDLELAAVGSAQTHDTLPLRAVTLGEQQAVELASHSAGGCGPAPAAGVQPPALPELFSGQPTEPPAGGVEPAGAVPFAELDAQDAVQEAELAEGRQLHQALADLLHARTVGRRRDTTAAGTVADFSADVRSHLPSQLRQLAERVANSATFAALVAASARAEEPWLLRTGDGSVEAGRFDAVAVEGSDWWIVDYKRTLPAERDAAWELHGQQLERYAAAAMAAGAAQVRLTLLGFDEPDRPHEWTLPAAAHG